MKKNLINVIKKNIKMYAPKGVKTLKLFQHKGGIDFEEIMETLTQCETDPKIKVIVFEDLTGNKVAQLEAIPFFCEESQQGYLEILEWCTNSTKIIVSKVKGNIHAEGLGLLAVSDVVIASDQAQFDMSEHLWKGVSSHIVPFLIQRLFYRKTKSMTPESKFISAKRAREIGLIDELTPNINLGFKYELNTQNKILAG